MHINIGIIILNYKTPNLVIDCLRSLVDQIEPDIKVVVVDNASNDGSVESINEQIKTNNWQGWAEVISSPINGGFSAGNNLGIQAVMADAYILLNSDTIVLPKAIKELRNAMKASPKAGLIAPACVNQQHGKDRNTFHFIHPVSEFIRAASTGFISNLLKKYVVPFEVNESPAEPDWVGFACVLIRREVIDQIGLLDEGYFMYFEDVDYCHRIKHAHWSVLYWPKAEIIHLLGGSSQFTAKQGIQTRAPRYFYEARARYFAKHYGRAGLISANLMWLTGHSIARMRQMFGNKNPHHRKNEARDIWINALHPFRVSSIKTDKSSLMSNNSKSPDTSDNKNNSSTPTREGNLSNKIEVDPNPGDSNLNPTDISFTQLIAEDFRTYENNIFEPGFWAIAIHRFGNLRMSIKPRLLRLPFSLIYKILHSFMSGFFGINLEYSVKLGRRVRLWHHGGMFLGAVSIGDDVTIRQNTTMGVLQKEDKWAKPVIEDRVDIGVGACILGNVTVGHDSVIGSNSVVVRSFPPHSTLFGVPARPVNLKPSNAAKK